MALFHGNFSNDMSYITFRYPFDVNKTEQGAFSNTYTDVPAKVQHLHNFRDSGEKICYLNIKLQIIVHGTNRSTSRTMLVYPSYKSPEKSCLTSNDRIIVQAQSINDVELHERIHFVRNQMFVWLLISLVMSVFQIYNADKFVLTVSERYVESEM
jgi:hypothetical protein